MILWAQSFTFMLYQSDGSSHLSTGALIITESDTNEDSMLVYVAYTLSRSAHSGLGRQVVIILLISEACSA